MSNVKQFLKIVVLTPISALILASLAFTSLNYPTSRATIVPPRFITDVNIELRDYINNAIAEITSREHILSRSSAFKILNASVRITVAPTSSRDGMQGSGVLIESNMVKSTKNRRYKSYILTNLHNVQSTRIAKIEKFSYLDEKFIEKISTYSGTIILRSDELDIALIEVISNDKIGEPVHLFDEKDLESIGRYEPVYVCGCSLGTSPAITNGNLSQINPSEYLVSAFAIFGNSGGGVFTSDCRLLGIARRIGGIQLPNGESQLLPNMTYLVPGVIIREWLAANKFDPN